VLQHTLELLHPFMPFLTEEIWQHLPEVRHLTSDVRKKPYQRAETGDDSLTSDLLAQTSDQEDRQVFSPATGDRRPRSIMIAPWPKRRPDLEDPDSEARMVLLMDVIRSIRNLRGELGLPPGKPARCLVVAGDTASRLLLERYASYVTQLAVAQPLEFAGPEQPKPKQALSSVVRGVEVYIPLAGLVDLDKEIARLEKESGAVSRELERVRGKLANESFLAKAPPEVIDKERGRETELDQKLIAIKRRVVMLSSQEPERENCANI
jgi:valyl-tRNA synthetase